MLSTLSVTVPVFALIFCGYWGGKRGVLPAGTVAGLNAFVFYFALPVMLFRAVALRPLAEIINVRFLAGYLCAGLVTYALAYWISRRALRESDGTAAAYALTASHANLGYLGLPLAAMLAGEQWVLPVILATVSDVTVVVTLTILLLERVAAKAQPGGGRPTARALLRVARSPMLIGVFLGVLWAVSAQPFPAPLDTFTRLLGAAAGPCALFAIGASLAVEQVGWGRGTLVLSAIKLVVHPLIVWLSLTYVFRVEPMWAAMATVAAALPGASNSFIIARQYAIRGNTVSATIMLTTFVGVITVSAVAWMLGVLPR